MIAARDLVSGYGRIRVLDGVTLTVGAGECVGILGHNGMGKTTLLKTIAGLVPTWSGEVRLDAKPLGRMDAARRARAGLGYVAQGRQIFAALSVRDNLRFGAVAKSLDEREMLAEALADFPELERLLDRPGGALSGGEQQLLALARALCGRPRALLLDEPTEGIQPSIVQAIAERVRLLAARRGLAVLLVEQNLDFIRALASRVLLIHRGRITRELTAAEMGDATLEAEFIGA